MRTPLSPRATTEPVVDVESASPGTGIKVVRPRLRLRALHLDPAALADARPHPRRPHRTNHSNRTISLTPPRSFRDAARCGCRREIGHYAPVRQAVIALAELGQMPDETAPIEAVQTYELLVQALAPPASDEEARVLLDVLPSDDSTPFRPRMVGAELHRDGAWVARHGRS
jgi:hypothetical protein